jgi:hypothetical protein
MQIANSDDPKFTVNTGTNTRNAKIWHEHGAGGRASATDYGEAGAVEGVENSPSGHTKSSTPNPTPRARPEFFAKTNENVYWSAWKKRKK